MSRLSIEKKHHLTHKKAKEAAQRVADDLKARFELNYAWRGNAIEFERPGLSGTMEIGKDNVRLDCELVFYDADQGYAIEEDSTPRSLRLGTELCELVRDGGEHRIDLIYGCVDPI